MNLAARLMQAAQDDVFCDATTYQRAQGRLLFEKLPAFALKGKTLPVAIYRPQSQAQTTRPLRPMIGRTAQRAILTEHLDALQRGTGGVVLIEGEPGIGKSRLVADLIQQAQDHKITVLVGAGDAIEKSTPYHAWRPVFSQLFNLDAFPRIRISRAPELAYPLRQISIHFRHVANTMAN